MMNIKVSPLLVLGVLIGALGIGASPAKAQQDIYQQFNNAKVAYVTSESEFWAATQLLFDLPSGTGADNPFNQAPAVIRFVKAGSYRLDNVNVGLPGSLSYSIEGPGSFYMDPSGATTISDPRTQKYGVTIVPGSSSAGRFIKVRSGHNISISGLSLIGFGTKFNQYAEGPTWKNSSHHPDAYGGTIYNAGTLTLTNVTIASSTVLAEKSRIKVDSKSGKATPNSDTQGGSALGGAIYNTGTLTMRGCTLFNNSVTTNAFDDGTAALGGAIYSSGDLDIANCTLHNNHAYGIGEETFYGDGYVLKTDKDGNELEEGDELIAGGRLAGGGSIAIDGGSAEIKNITITDSSANSGYEETKDDGAYGGGIYWRDGFSNPTNSIFAGNTISRTGRRPNFQYKRPSPYKPQFESGRAVGSNVASGTSSPNIFTYGLGGLHNMDASSSNFLTPLDDNGGSTLTRAPATRISFPVDNGILPYENTPAQIANYLDGIDQRGAKRVIKGSKPDATSPEGPDTSDGTPILDIGAVEAEFTTSGALIRTGGNTTPFIERPSDSGSTDADDSNGDPNHDVTIDDLEVKDADAYGHTNTQIVEVTIDFPDGKIITDFSGEPGITVVSRSEDDQTVVLRGTIDAINAALAKGLTLYRSDGTTDFPPNFSITVNDLGNNGYGGDEVYSDITTNNLIDPAYNPAIYINPQNHAPHVSVPGTQYVKQNGDSTDYNTLVFSKDNGNSIYVSDPDINAPIDPSTGQGTNLPPGYDRSGLHLQVELKASDGSISLGNGSGIDLIGSSTSSNGSNAMIIEGTPTALNLAFEGMSYRPNPGITSDSISIDVDDLGNYGEGGPKSANGSIPIKVSKDGKGGDHSNSVRWEVTGDPILSSNKVTFTYELINLSNTDITNITASGSITGGGYFVTSDVKFAPSIGYGEDISYDFLSPKIQRDLDPTKNGLSVAWGLRDSKGNSYILRQGKSAFLRVTVPAHVSATGKQVAGSWKVNFTKLDPNGNAKVPGSTAPVRVQ